MAKKIDKRTYQQRKIYKQEQERKDTELLTDRAIIKTIKRHTNLKSKEIRENPELMELYRARILIKRELKKCKD